MPLVPAGEPERPPLGEAGERARKVDPRFAHGEVSRVAVGRHQAEAEMIQGMLLEEGIPSILRRSGGFDVPDFLAAGPRDVCVPASAVDTARELLTPVGVDRLEKYEPDPPKRVALKLAAGMLAFLLLFGAMAGVIYQLA